MKKVEKEIKKFLKDRGWDKLRPGDLAKSVSIESGELLEIFQWSNPELNEIKKNKEKIAEIKKELADVFIYCFDISTTLGFDTEKIILDKLKYIDKKYPAKLMKNMTKNKEPGNDSEYWRIKKEYRSKQN